MIAALFRTGGGIATSLHRDLLKGGGLIMRYKRTYIWAYLDGRKLVDVIQAALDNNTTVDAMKKLLTDENPGHEVTFRIVKK